MPEATCSVYILLTRSRTLFSRLIGLATDDAFTHASIGLDGPGGRFYSFARLYDPLALPAGMVEEHRRWHSRAWSGTPCRLYELRVPAPVYRRLRRRLDAMYTQRERYGYNLLGVLACWFQCPLPRRRHFFCSQFVAQLLVECGAAELEKPPALVRPADLERLEGLRPVSQGAVGAVA